MDIVTIDIMIYDSIGFLQGKKRLITPASIKQARETLNMEKDDRYVEDSDNLAVQIWIYHPRDKNHTLEVSTMMMRAR